MSGENEEGILERVERWKKEIACVEARHASACRAFFIMGGYRKFRAVRSKLIKENADRKAQAMRLRLKNFMAQGSCSGRPCPHIPETQKVLVRIGKRMREREATRAAERLWREGKHADKKGKWAVDEVLRVRRSLDYGGCEVLVEWVGTHEPSWVKMRDLSAELRAVARRMWDEERRPQMEERRERRAVGRKSRGASATDAQGQVSGECRVRKSPRLVELEEKAERLKKAIVPYERPVGEKATMGTKLGERKVKRVWGVHEVSGSEHVHVVWADGEGDRGAVVPLAWLSGEWRVVVPVDRRTEVCLRTFSVRHDQDPLAAEAGTAAEGHV